MRQTSPFSERIERAVKTLETHSFNGDGPLRRDAARIPFDQTVCERDDSRRAAIVLR